MLIFQTYVKAWPLCLGFVVFYLLFAAVVTWTPLPGKNWALSARKIFWSNLIFWLIFMSIVTTLIDSPYLPVSQEVITWLFMTSAFLGLPLSMPPFAALIWGFFAWLRGEKIAISSLGLLMLAAFCLGAFTSNMHDVLWCGVITHGYSQLHPAGGDLLPFYVLASLFGIPKQIQEDYATFGSCMVIMVFGELFMAGVCLRRLAKLEKSFKLETPPSA